MKMKKIITFLILIAVVCVAGCSAPDNVSMAKDVPVEVDSGEIFNFTVSVNNEDLEAHELRSIDIGHTFLEGILVIKTEPGTKEEYDAGEWHIFEFKKNMPAESETQVVFTAKALKSGDFSGDLDVCVDGDASCLSNSIRIIVN